MKNFTLKKINLVVDDLIKFNDDEVNQARVFLFE